MASAADDVLRLRLQSQLLTDPTRRDPADIVTWFGAMQSQDLESGLWSFGVRSVGLTRDDVERATEQRAIVRTWPMRGTIHFVPPADARWMLQLTGVRAIADVHRRREQLGLDEPTVHRAVDVLAGALTGGRRLSRPECMAVLNDAGIATDGQRGYHLLWFASQIGVTCIGPQMGKQQTFVLLDEWVANPNRPERDDALAELARRYFRSHGPATRHDFARWTGLTLADTDRAIAGAGDALVAEDIAGTPYVLAAGLRDMVPARPVRAGSGVHLLPGFDEFILGYRDRMPMVAAEHAHRVVPGNNGVFMATVVDRGRVVGTWRRSVGRQGVRVEVDPFDTIGAGPWRGVVSAANRYGSYLGVESTTVLLDEASPGLG